MIGPQHAFKTVKDLQPTAEPVQSKVDNTIKTLPKIIGKITNRAYVTEGINSIRHLAITYKKYNIAPRLITALEQIAKDRKALNDGESAKVAEDAVKEINEAK